MTQLRVRRGTDTHPFLLCGKQFRNGDVIESREFPLTPQKWAQLAEHGLVELTDKPGVVSTARLDRIKAIYQTGEGAAFREEIAAEIDEPGASCPSCDFVASSPHGLLIHTARKHKE